MYNYWRSNRNVILTAVALFVVSLTALLFFLIEHPEGEHGELKANVVDSLTIKSQQEEEKTYRSLLDEYDHDGPLVVLGLDGYVEFSSWDFETVAGYRLEDVKEELIYSFIHPDDLGMFLGAVGKALSTETPVMMVGPYRLRAVNGEYRLQMASFYPIKKEEKVQSIIIAIRDITGGVEEEAAEESHSAPTYEPSQRYEPREVAPETEYSAPEYEVKGASLQNQESSMEQTILPDGNVQEELPDPNQEAREAQQKKHERREERREQKELETNPSSSDERRIRNTEDDGDDKRLIVDNVESPTW